ncbi:MAG TPA: glycosyltransferase family 4 protein [Acidimicrobiales bacterium]|nr:glycosyltransferase family 4 protein [Acidimicrobiales bacterium]
MTYPAPHDRMAEVAERSGLRAVHLAAWRDRDDPEAGGSEEHASQLAAHWARAGLDVTIRTSRAPGRPSHATRDGFRVVRRGGRLTVLARTAAAGAREGWGRGDHGLVDVFHGLPFFSPLWAGPRRVGFVHHVHLGTWRLLVPTPLAPLMHATERWIVPAVYRRSRLVTPSPSTRDDLVQRLRLDRSRIGVAPNTVDERFAPGGDRSATPLVAAVGRLMPQKGFDTALTAIAEVLAARPDAEAVVVGEGSARPALEAQAAALGIAGRVRFTGRVSDEALVDWYRRAWVVVNASRHEGWGLTLTEAMACGTPVVASRIPGHVDAVEDGRTGVLVTGAAEMAAQTLALLDDAEARDRMGRLAAESAVRGWATPALTVLEALAAAPGVPRSDGA